MAQGVEKLQNFLACTCAHKVHQVILISSHKWSSILYSLVDYIPHSKDFSLIDRNLPLCTAFRQCVWPRLCPPRLALGKIFSHPEDKERLEEKQPHPIYWDSHSRQLESATGESEASLFPLSSYVSQVGGRRGTAPTHFGSGKLVTWPISWLFRLLPWLR